MRRTLAAKLVAAVVASLALTHCSKPEEPPPSPAPASPPATTPTTTANAPAPMPPSPSPGAGMPLQWSDPPRWTRRKPSSPMRLAEYDVPHASGDATDAECTVITFGPGQGGAIDDNISRWVGQFNPPSGSPTKEVGTVSGMKVTRVEVTGAYHPMQMPGAPSAPPPIANARLIGTIVEAPTGLWFFKLTGPDATVKAAATDFDAMMSSLHAPPR
jgi:hypothetical protein